MGGAVFSLSSLARGQTMVGVMATSFKRAYASMHGSQDCCIQWPWARGRPQSTRASAGDSWTLIGKSGSVFCGVLSPGSWCAQGFVCALQESVSPVLWESCNQIPLVLSQIPWEFSVPLLDPQVGKSVVSSRTFAIVWELLWYNCSPVYGSSAWWLCNGANGDLLQEDLCHMPRLPGLLQPEPLSLWQATADPCLCRRHSNTQRQVWLCLLWGPWVLIHTRFCLSPLSISGGYGVWF